MVKQLNVVCTFTRCRGKERVGSSRLLFEKRVSLSSAVHSWFQPTPMASLQGMADPSFHMSVAWGKLLRNGKITSQREE